MPSVELSKLPSVGAARAPTASERAQVETRAAAPTAASGTPGISLEVAAASATPSPPVDAERVAAIRAALRDGSYPLVPTRIADAMIAAQVSLSIPERS
ncbi:flagellar biosynthesis anti-sigma factor FlgM [Erythrobacter sp. WG]|uniref:flagellar biosynthesis anti-sigma factor FlgM n=1 Tax=Erythrobacter sp. WG TaxID=2985510 RepID=UPI00226DDD5F|nr:flagellar biosynthesis anti-sigma factor FlgM [Erythrobacter sp. WG]MCX9148144.1 flagellar biosynthesis anti-sigma factor FlgM [Erythrobacter sp. WG]